VIASAASAQAGATPIRQADGGYASLYLFSVGLQPRNGDASLPNFYFQTKEEADRIAFAFDFLRRECALKSDTGF
jgi:hypothetical protein